MIACCLAFLLAGCGGGAVAVRSNFADGHAGPPARVAMPTAPANAGQGLKANYSGSGNLGLAILAVVIVADVVQWTTTKLTEAFGPVASLSPQSAGPGSTVPTPKKCVYPRPEMC
jgi:hypothetical protein